MITPLLRDPGHWRQIQTAGYLQVPVLPPSVVALLLEEFERFHPVLPASGFVSSTYSADLDYKKAVNDRVTDIIRPYLDPLFCNHRLLGGTFLYKMPGPQSGVPLHQDWTVVDEDRHMAINVWMPLVDADMGNGTLQVLPGSQRAMRTLRAPTLPPNCAGHEKLLMEHMLPIPTRAGDALVINQATIHSSPPNLSDIVRPAITIGLVSADTPLRFYYRDPQRTDGRIEMFEQGDDFYLGFENFHRDIFQRPTFGRLVGEVDYAVPSRTAEEAQALIDESLRLSTLVPEGLGA
jgi:Phytanoyl-CoA dioxygenase (PhyH)